MAKLTEKYKYQLSSGLKKSVIAKNMASDNPAFSRQDFLELLIGSLGMTEAGASTYYGKYIRANLNREESANESNEKTCVCHATSRTTEQHLEVLFENILSAEEESWTGCNIRKYASDLSSLGLQIDVDAFPNAALSRKQVFDYVKNSSSTLLNSCILICAWGGMNRKHCCSAFSNWLGWKAVAENILDGCISRKEAYEAFSRLRKNRNLPGMGPAYFTKIIYFLSKPKNRGYIMDQWTARSFNLLHGQHDIRMNKQVKGSGEIQAHVSDKNTSIVYEKFCRFIENTAVSLGEAVSADDVELSMFSEGKGRGVWRSYLISQDKHIYLK
ncbi:hypothetical protein [Microbulbifer hydrolyticus]|uniref:Uncharacterized protein n=1 Tax=Microbulbifer hydrolyticus TaxID=48074 RepID=A0A6P1T7X6_9GAMM|nr:hypothetical protein [Microbulbifer hydrolyticus]MBB5211479.1 hypothetical protein [Microbulbifer hydrolyticus]QHQ37770.1 hypothetical protein GTQ55_01385 [Microbulbifer hydrolyticus]